MTTLTESQHLCEKPLWKHRTFHALSALAVLIVAADALAYGVELGLGLAILFLLLTGAVVAVNRRAAFGRRAVALIALAVLADVTFLEAIPLHWPLFALALNAILALELGGLLGRFSEWLGPGLRFIALAPVRLFADGLQLLSEAAQARLGGRIRRAILASVVPLVFAAVFIGLFAAANPVIENLLRLVRIEAALSGLAPDRMLFWFGIAFVFWPVLLPRLLALAPQPQWQGPLRPHPESVLFGRTAIRNGLVVFNVIFAGQMSSDLAFLWGGVRLPDGLTYADYAHRGAYPLIVAALLAAAFMLVTMRKGGAAESDRLIRVLVYSWIALTISLVFASLTRLDLYIDAYGLTDLRLYAGIWMVLVACGLALIIVRLIRGLSNQWLVMANLATLTVTMWAVCLLNVPATIAWFNVLHAREMGGAAQSLDFYQMNDIGPEAIPALDHLLAHATFVSQQDAHSFWLLRENLRDSFASTARPWQSWTWRNDRLISYLAAHPVAPEPPAGLFDGGGRVDPTATMPEEGSCRGC